MLAENNPEAWQELLRLIAEKAVDDALADHAARHAVVPDLLPAPEPACAH